MPTSTATRFFPDVATDQSGDFVIVWPSARDGGNYGIFAQRYTASRVGDIDGDGAVAPLTDGLLLLRYLFGFRGATLVTGAVASGCTRCAAPAIESHIVGNL